MRFIISRGTPHPAGDCAGRQRSNAAFEPIKGTPLEGSKVYLPAAPRRRPGTCSTAPTNYDLGFAGLPGFSSSSCWLLTRSVVAAAVIVGTADSALSLGTSFPAPSVLIWQHIISMPLRWMVLAGHHPAGGRIGLQPAAGVPLGDPRRHHTGIIRSMAGTGAGGDLGRSGVCLRWPRCFRQRPPPRRRLCRQHDRTGPAVRLPW